ncbi:MAG: hypothetical protein WBZ01_04505 [Terriglobales bacterium]|jgi:hypothetical protein
MSIIVRLMIGGWATSFAMFSFFALNESGKLLRIRQRIALSLEAAARRVRVAEESLQPEHEEAA